MAAIRVPRGAERSQFGGPVAGMEGGWVPGYHCAPGLVPDARDTEQPVGACADTVLMKNLRSSLVASLFAAALGPACTKPNPEACIEGHCSDSTLPFCDVDGSISGTPGTCVSVDCEPGAFKSCSSATEALVCNDMGTTYDRSHCDLGCDEASGCITSVTTCDPGVVTCGDRVVQTCGADGHFSAEVCDVSCIDGPTPHCSYLSPKYLPDVCDALATAAHLDLGPFNTDIDSQCNGGIVPQAGGPDICVLRYSTITIPAGIEAKITGHRALALVADDSLDVLGTLDVSADGIAPGPAGGIAANESSYSSDYKGGGGGGFGAPGGAGGSTSAPGGGANGGAPLAFPFTTLTGPGWAPPSMAILVSASSSGGGSGGAATLVSCRGVTRVPGMIDAGGGGGEQAHSRNFAGQSAASAGAGGGAGGYVLLQGLDVKVTGSVYANGGGGGSGFGTSVGMDGSDGVRTVGPTLGGQSPGSGAGGTGGWVSAGAGFGAGGGSTSVAGGGGSVGVLELAVPAGVIPAVPTTGLSPGFRDTTIAVTR